jgi:hypothetical protein
MEGLLVAAEVDASAGLLSRAKVRAPPTLDITRFG